MKFIRPFFFLILLVLPFKAAHAVYPGTIWSSDRITDSLIGVRVGRVFGDGGTDVVAISPSTLYVFRATEGKLTKVFQAPTLPGSSWIKVSLFDVDGDGTQEIALSAMRPERVESVLAKVDNQRLTILDKVPGYLTALKWEGRPVLVGQKGYGESDYTGPLEKLSWNGKKLVPNGRIALPGGLSGKSMGLFSVAGIDNGFLYLSPSGALNFYEQAGKKFKKRWVSGEDYGGSVYYLNREVKNVLNQVENNRFFVPPSFHYRSSTITLIKNSGYLKNVIGAVPSVKNAQFIQLTWTGYGFQEGWNSPRMDGAISDLDLLDWDGDGSAEIIATLLLRDRGYVDTLKKQDSLIIVVKPAPAPAAPPVQSVPETIAAPVPTPAPTVAEPAPTATPPIEPAPIPPAPPTPQPIQP